MIKINLINIHCLIILVMVSACSSFENVASKPITQSKQVTQNVISSKKITQRNIKFDNGSFIAIKELSSLDGILIVKASNAYQNKQSDLIFTKNAILRFKCGDNTSANMIQINNNQFSVPVILQNKDHVPTGCLKSNGMIKFAKFIK
jgi:hypothetical protein